MTADLRTARRVRLLPAAVLLATAAVALQIAYPLVHGGVRDSVTVLIVAAFAAVWAVHAAGSYGAGVAAAMVALTAGGGFAVEVLGVHTGVPFGRYAYADTLGASACGVPLVIGLAWTMLAWPAAIAARRLATSMSLRIAVGAWALASADLFLDPQMVAAGYWRWRQPAPHLPGVGTVPLSNYAGWLLVALLLSAALQWLLRDRAGADERLPLVLYLWLYAGWVVALAAFLDLRAAAAWGALGMGAVAVPLAWRVAR